MVSNLMHFLFLEESDREVPCILFTLYIDDLLYELKQSGVDFFWDALAYADDLTLQLLTPSPAALMRLFICEQFGAANKLKFNPDKTQSSRSCTVSACKFFFFFFFCGGQFFVLSLLCT